MEAFGCGDFNKSLSLYFLKLLKLYLLIFPIVSIKTISEFFVKISQDVFKS